jgi:hypothetical protein
MKFRAHRNTTNLHVVCGVYSSPWESHNKDYCMDDTWCLASLDQEILDHEAFMPAALHSLLSSKGIFFNSKERLECNPWMKHVSRACHPSAMFSEYNVSTCIFSCQGQYSLKLSFLCYVIVKSKKRKFIYFFE